MQNPNLKILLAEDDLGHATLIKRNLSRAGVSNELLHFKDGQELLDYLHLLESQGSNDPPLLLLLDINMPKLTGYDVLKWLKESPSFAKIPVIVLTTTDDPREIDRCYQLGCSIYITKPVVYEAFADAIKRLGLVLQIIKVPYLNHTMIIPPKE